MAKRNRARRVRISPGVAAHDQFCAGWPMDVEFQEPEIVFAELELAMRNLEPADEDDRGEAAMIEKQNPAPRGVGTGPVKGKCNVTAHYSSTGLPSQGIIADIADALALQDTESWYHLKLKAAHHFSALNGWRFTWNAFSPEDIGKRSRGKYPPREWFDHPLFYRAGGRNAALVGQPYDYDIERLRREGRQLATKLGLAFSVAPNLRASFHCPGRTLFAILHEPGHTITWLPEQLGEIHGAH